jgi:hypothetical protein
MFNHENAKFHIWQSRATQKVKRQNLQKNWDPIVFFNLGQS